MEKSEIIRRLEKIASHAVHVVWEKPFVMSLDDRIAVDKVLELLKEQEAQRDYEASVDMAEYCERYEQTYNPEDGSM